MTVTITIDYYPTNDGIDHINVYSQGETTLGMLLSNFARTPFTCEDGRFESVEGYWYWLAVVDKQEREVLRTLYGHEAKKVGKFLLTDTFGPGVPTFKLKICKAIRAKLEANGIDKMLAASDLPLVHYYVYGGKKVDAGYSWIMVFLERLRAKYKDQLDE